MRESERRGLALIAFLIFMTRDCSFIIYIRLVYNMYHLISVRIVAK